MAARPPPAASQRPPNRAPPARQVYLREIGDLLLRMPRPLLLLLKTNDCLRSVDNALGSPLNTVCAGAAPGAGGARAAGRVGRAKVVRKCVRSVGPATSLPGRTRQTGFVGAVD